MPVARSSTGDRRIPLAPLLDLLEQGGDPVEPSAGRGVPVALAPANASSGGGERDLGLERRAVDHARGRLGVRVEDVALLRLRDGEPSRHHDREQRSHEVHDSGGPQTQRGPNASVSTPAAAIARPRIA